jgi:hypothetical protein
MRKGEKEQGRMDEEENWSRGEGFSKITNNKLQITNKYQITNLKLQMSNYR